LRRAESVRIIKATRCVTRLLQDWASPPPQLDSVQAKKRRKKKKMFAYLPGDEGTLSSPSQSLSGHVPQIAINHAMQTSNEDLPHVRILSW
jgi:hypothetical protein